MVRLKLELEIIHFVGYCLSPFEIMLIYFLTKKE